MPKRRRSASCGASRSLSRHKPPLLFGVWSGFMNMWLDSSIPMTNRQKLKLKRVRAKK